MSGTFGSGSETGELAAPTAPVLVRVLDADAPLSPPSRHSLHGTDRIVLQRAERLTATRAGRELVLGVPDRRMSEQHARLEWLAHHWMLRDLGSKNGLRIEGAPVSQAMLEVGDVFECGRTFFVLAGPDPVEPPLDRTFEPTGLVSLSPALAASFAVLDRTAPSSVGLVIIGETGTGKELVARAAHVRSGRAGAFVAVNAGAIPASLVEATLFGHVRGAFSGATADQLGVLRAADRGTLLLDEIADLSHHAQTALLRALQEREVVPVGATRPVAIDVRIVVATQRPLAALAADGTLRADLVHRLAGPVIELPPLRDRRIDTGLVIAALLARMPAATRPSRISPAAARALLEHDWPGNIRELEKALEIAALHAAGGTIELAHLALPRPEPATLSVADQAKRDELMAVLAEHRGNISAVARALAKDRVQIRRWVARFGLDPARYR